MNEIEGAKWLLVGFQRHWSMSMLDHRLRELQLDRFGFMPESAFWYKSPVRGFVATCYPKLNKYLIDHPVGEWLKIAEQITKLRPKVERARGALLTSERSELKNSRRLYRARQQSYGVSRDSYQSRRSTEWGVCS